MNKEIIKKIQKSIFYYIDIFDSWRLIELFYYFISGASLLLVIWVVYLSIYSIKMVYIFDGIIILYFIFIFWLSLYVILNGNKIGIFINRYISDFSNSKNALNSVDKIIILTLPALITLISYIAFQKQWSLLIYTLMPLALCSAFLYNKRYRIINATRKTPQTEDSACFSDEAISTLEYDELSRESFVKSMKKRIQSYKGETSVVYGLYGEWGEGKTSILNCLEHELTNSNIFVIRFDPWFYQDEKSIVINFYRNFLIELNRKYFLPPNIKRLLNLLPKMSIGLPINIFSINVELNRDDSFNESKLIAEIEDYLVSRRIGVLFIFDDIDRLSLKEIITVFRIVMLGTSIRNVQHILSMDVKHVVSILEKSKYDHKFIEKIVQIPFYIPTIDTRIIHRNLIRYVVNNQIHDYKNQESFPELKEKISENKIMRLFTNFRQVKRVLNIWNLKIGQVYNEVNLYDFFVLTIIECLYPEIYSDIRSNPRFYLHKHDLYYNFDEFHGVYSGREEELIKISEKHILETVKPFSEIDQENILNLLNIIFESRNHPSVDNRTLLREKRIANTTKFRKYFDLGVRSDEISDEEYQNSIEKWRNDARDIEKDIDKIKDDKKLLGLIERMELNIDKLDLRKDENIIEFLYLHSEMFDKTTSDYRTIFPEYTRMYYLVRDLILDCKTEKQAEIIEDIIQHTNYVFTYSLLRDLIDDEKKLTNQSKSKLGEWKEMLYERFKKKFIETNRNIFEEYRDSGLHLSTIFNASLMIDDKSEITKYLIKQLDYNNDYYKYIVEYDAFQKDNLGGRLKQEFQIEKFIDRIDKKTWCDYVSKIDTKKLNEYAKNVVDASKKYCPGKNKEKR